ncbi:hypothetical protein [Actinoplanes sp. NPDC051851]|uniref:hypothetical protein n=1 Tax=Actinoplanes sp. NPDC051851 TaxID=3154753 RepID=UPI0034123079
MDTLWRRRDLTTGAAALGTMAGGALITWLGAPALTFVLAGWLTLLAVVATASRAVRASGHSVPVVRP